MTIRKIYSYRFIRHDMTQYRLQKPGLCSVSPSLSLHLNVSGQWERSHWPHAALSPEDSSSMAARPEQPDTGDTGQTGTAEKVSYFIVKLKASFTHFVRCRRFPIMMTNPECISVPAETSMTRIWSI